tara:strand:- start:399 stop:896 length:498 start_codon:yes stop_codon:yes gene_type:complete
MEITTAFSTGDTVVYPNHGVGKLEKIESQTIAGQELKVLVINFEKKRMTLRLPLVKAKNTGLRNLTTKDDMGKTLALLTKKIKTTKGIWARRAQEYETKINSGSIISLSEVLRELHRDENQGDQSYSERQIYQNALERFADEVAVVEAIQFEDACEKLKTMLRVA